MSRYIDADIAVAQITRLKDNDSSKYDLGLDTAINEIKHHMPTADVVGRKRGEWVEAKPMSRRIGKVCSACGNEAYWDTDYGQQLFDYCPYCGSYNGEEEG